MRHFNKLLLSTGTILLLVAAFSPAARAENLDTIFKRVTDYVAQKNYTKALEELGWANKEIEKMNSEFIQSFFPTDIEGFKGGKFESSNALGFSNLERSYTSGNKEIKVSLAGGQSMGAMAGLGGLAAIGKMAAMMGNQAGQDTFRIAGRTATLSENEGSGGELSVFLDSGSVLQIQNVNNVDGATLRKFAEAIKVEALDSYLRGQSK